jgi:hypothetical protein
MIVVVVRSQNQSYVGRKIDSQRSQVFQGRRPSWTCVETGVDDYPLIIREMQYNTFSVAGSKYGYFNLIDVRPFS